jgi:molybdenum cofactor biosynthesis enzyme
MKNTTEQAAKITGNVINFLMAVSGAAVCIYGLAKAVLLSHAFGF